MSISDDDVKKIAHLARLHISHDDVPAYAASLSSIFELVEQMQSVNTDDVEPMAHPLDIVQRLRIDQVNETDQRDKYQAIAPLTDSGLYLVPKVIE